MQISRSFCVLAALSMTLCAFGAEDADVKSRIRAVRDLGKGGSEAIPQLEAWMRDPATEVRLEAVKAIADIGSKSSIDPLLAATRENDPEIQMRAVDGIVNFYLPGYMQSRIQKFGTKIKGAFSDQNDQVIPAFVTVRQDVIPAIGKLVSGGASMESRATAARAIGVLRGHAALPELYKGLHSKDSAVIYESLVAIQKIGDPAAATNFVFLMGDLDDKVQIAALETAGVLRSREASDAVRKAYTRARNNKVKRAALTALAMIADPESRSLYKDATSDKDDGVRAAAWEGFARLKDPADENMLREAFDAESKAAPRLAQAFGLVNLGRTEVTEFSPLQYLVNTLNSRAHRGEAEPILIELARSPQVRENLYPLLASATREEKIGLARVLSVSGDKNSIAALDKLSRDGDSEVAEECLRALRVLKARLP
jgi:HEAT repeat protein